MSSPENQPGRWKRLEDIFQAVLDLPPGERTSYLLEHCADDEALRTEVEKLLAQYQEAGSFLDAPALQNSGLLSTLRDHLDTLEQAGEPLVGRRAGPYRIEAEIGRGGMGTVYRAVRDDGAFDQRVALKLVRRGLDTAEILDRFRRERQILAMVNHPNIARLFDGGSTDDGRPYFVMELIAGRTLVDYCSQQNVTLEGRLRLFREVCAAVGHAHQNLIIHRDLKPANIMVTNEGQVKLLDFGIAKMLQPDFADPARTQPAPGSLLTPDYASPEQVRGEPVTTATDVYALGLILFELLTGKKAQRVPSSSIAEIERVVCQTLPQKPSDTQLEGVAHLPGKLRGDLDNIVLKAIQKEPGRRYLTVTQLAEDIERYSAGRPVIARPDSAFYRASKFVTRNKWGVAAAAALLLTLAGGIIATTRQTRIAREHFNSVRSLSKSLLTEIDAATIAVPGTTKARHLIVQRSIEYLDKLEKSSRDDVDLMAELAEAYKAVATIQGNRNRSNLGDYSGAMVSYRKALDLHRRIEEIRPSPQNRQWIPLVGSEAARVYPDSEEAGRLAKEAVEVAEGLERDFPGKYDLAVGNANFTLGYIHYNREEPEESISYFNRTRELFVRMKRGKNNLAVCDRYIAFGLMSKGRLAEALEISKRARDLDQEHVATHPTPRARMDLSYDFIWISHVLQKQGKFAEALESARKCESMRKELAAADPNDQRTRVALIDTDEFIGSILGDMGRMKESVPLLERTVAAREMVLKATPESPEDQADLARAQATLGRNYRRIGKCREGDDLLSQARAVFAVQHRSISLKDLESVPGCLTASR